MAIASLTPGVLYHQLALGAEQEHSEVPIKVPNDLENFKDEDFPHWVVFAGVHLGQAFEQISLFCNAKIISEIPDDKINSVTLKDLEELGVVLIGGRWD